MDQTQSIELFLERVAELRTSSAIADLERTSITINETSVEIEGPQDEAAIAFFTRIRPFDTRKNPIFIETILGYLREAANSDRIELIDALVDSYRHAGMRPFAWSTHVLGPGKTPRDVWELWVYSQILHIDDADKRAKWASMDELDRKMAMHVAYVYVADIYAVVAITDTLFREPDLGFKEFMGRQTPRAPTVAR